jgi:hypothetical protein
MRKQFSLHITLSACHKTKGDDTDLDDRLLVEEVWSIVRQMQARFSQEEFETVITVSALMLSFMGEQHGSISRGCYDGANLTFHVSNCAVQPQTER